jgi:hypothetical protein
VRMYIRQDIPASKLEQLWSQPTFGERLAGQIYKEILELEKVVRTAEATLVAKMEALEAKMEALVAKIETSAQERFILVDDTYGQEAVGAFGHLSVLEQHRMQ